MTSRVFDGTFLEPLTLCSNIEYYGRVKLENLPEKLINGDLMDQESIDKYGCLQYRILNEDSDSWTIEDLSHDAYIIYTKWFINGITVDEMEETLNTINEMKKVVYNNKDVNKDSIEIIENEVIENDTCLDFNYCIKFNFF